MIEVAGPSYINGMREKPANNKGKIKIYNEKLGKVKYISSNDSITNYPGFIIGGPKKSNSLDTSYINNLNYIKQLKERFKNTKFIYNDSLQKCIRVKISEVEKFVADGWSLGRKFYRGIR